MRGPLLRTGDAALLPWRRALRTSSRRPHASSLWGRRGTPVDASTAQRTSAAARTLRKELFGLAEATLQDAIREGVVRPDVPVDHFRRLVCGVEHAVRLGDGDDRELQPDVMLSGLAPK